MFPEHERIRFLSESELDALLKAVRESKSPYLYPVVMIALTTGLRKGEILGLRWDQVELDPNRCGITLEPENTKNRSRQFRPISKELANLLAEWRRRLSREGKLGEFVFPSESGHGHLGCINHAWYTALKKAGLKDFRFHDFRHTFASWLRKRGFPWTG